MVGNLENLERSKEKKREDSYFKLKALKGVTDPFKRPILPMLPRKRVKVVEENGRLSE